MAGADAATAVQRLLADQPHFHGQGTVTWSATAGTLSFLARAVDAGDHTLETGAGASTVVFAAAGARHTAISPSAQEHELIAAYCGELGVDAGRVTFVAQPSDQVLPTLVPDAPWDLVFIDGAHSFPYPVLDWHFAARHLRVGGILVLDDVPIPAVAVAFNAMRAEPQWEFQEWLDERAAVFRKVAEAPEGDYWRGQRFNRTPQYSALPFQARIKAIAAHESERLMRTLDRRAPGVAERVRRAKRGRR